MPFVIDASTSLSWCFRDETNAYADAVLDALDTDSALAPDIWPLEVANVLVIAERRRRLSAADVTRATAILQSLQIRVVNHPLAHALSTILDVARTYGLTAYDASYLALAMQERLPLATIDEDMRTAARRAGVVLHGLT